MAVERKKEKTKTPAELAKEKTESPKAETKPTGEGSGAARKAADEAAPATRRAPARRRRAAEPKEPPPPRARPVVRAQAKYVRSSARKARLVIEHIRGKQVDEARAVLRHTPRGVARDLEKLLNSAIANAENNHDLVGDDLFIKEAYADEGPTLKRFRPRALGRATRIRKRTSHLTLTLTPKD